MNSLPDQTIAEHLKDEEWHKSHVNGYVNDNLNDSNGQSKEILKLYRAYNGELNEEEAKLIETVTDPHGYSLGVEYVIYPLIQSKVEQIVGEFIQRPIRRKAYVKDKKSKNAKYQKKLDMLAEQFAREITEGLQSELGFKAETKNPQMEIPENIDEHDFKTIAEEVADSLIDIFLDVKKEGSKLKQFFIDYCISDRAHAVLHKDKGFTASRKVHPLDVCTDLDPYKVVQDDHEFFFENYYLSENEIYNTFQNLTKEQKLSVKEMFESMSATHEESYNSEELGTALKYNGWFQTNNKVNKLRLVHAMWKSRKRISVKVSEGKKGKKYYKRIDSDYKARQKDKIEHIDGEMPRFVMMLGPDICLDYGVMDKRYSHVDAPYSCELPVLSIIRDNTIGSSVIKSVAAKLYQLQQIASEVLFEIRVALKSAGDSRVLVYDSAQTPKEFTKAGYQSGLNRVMHHIKKDKLMIINSKQKGFNSSFNQFTSLDLSQKGAIQDLFNGLAIIEDLASKFIGMAPEREGQVGDYQTATGTDKAIRGSTARTEVLFTPFDEFIVALLEKVILRGKHDYENGEVIQYIVGDKHTKFLKLFGDFFLADFGVHLSDSRKDKEASERIDRAAEMALSNSNTPEMVMGLIEVFEGDSASEKKQVFKRMLDSMEQMRQQQMQAQSEAEEKALASEAEEKEKDRGLSREGHDKDIKVANIYNKGKAMSDFNKNASNERVKYAEIEQKDRAANKGNNKEKEN